MYTPGKTETKPEANGLPAEAFDEKGDIKKEFYVTDEYSAYPKKHSVWDKLTVESADMTLKQFASWFEDEHNLDMGSWNFIIGHKKGGESGKENVPVSTIVYPPPVAFDYALMPALTVSQGDAMREIMGSKVIPQVAKMKYLNEWKTAQAKGSFPEGGADPKLVITNDSSLRQVLEVMARKAEIAVTEGKIDPKLGVTIDLESLKTRKFWLIQSDETPSCDTVPTYVDGDDEAIEVKHLAAIKIPLQ